MCNDIKILIVQHNLDWYKCSVKTILNKIVYPKSLSTVLSLLMFSSINDTNLKKKKNRIWKFIYISSILIFVVANAFFFFVAVSSNFHHLLVTTWTAAYQAPPSMGFSRQEYWSGVPLPSPVEV